MVGFCRVEPRFQAPPQVRALQAVGAHEPLPAMRPTSTPWWRRPRSAAPRRRVGHGHDGTRSQSHQVLYQGEHRYCRRVHPAATTSRITAAAAPVAVVAVVPLPSREETLSVGCDASQEHPCSPSVVADQNERDELLHDRDSPAPAAGLVGRSAPLAVVDDLDHDRVGFGPEARRSPRHAGCRRARRSCSPPRSRPAPGRLRPAWSGRAVPAIGASRRAAVPVVRSRRPGAVDELSRRVSVDDQVAHRYPEPHPTPPATRRHVLDNAAPLRAVDTGQLGYGSLLGRPLGDERGPTRLAVDGVRVRRRDIPGRLRARPRASCPHPRISSIYDLHAARWYPDAQGGADLGSRRARGWDSPPPLCRPSHW